MGVAVQGRKLPEQVEGVIVAPGLCRGLHAAGPIATVTLCVIIFPNRSKGIGNFLKLRRQELANDLLRYP